MTKALTGIGSVLLVITIVGVRIYSSGQRQADARAEARVEEQKQYDQMWEIVFENTTPKLRDAAREIKAEPSLEAA